MKIPDTEEISLKEVILHFKTLCRYLLSKWILIMVAGIVGAITGFYIASKSKPIYTAVTTFVLEDNSGNGLGEYAGLASAAGIDLGLGAANGMFQGDNILELYKSRSMMQEALLSNVIYGGKSIQLIDYYITSKNLRKAWVKNARLRNITFGKKEHDNRIRDSIISIVVNDINKNYLSVTKPDPKLSIIRAEVKFPDEFFAKAFNEKIVQTVNDFYVQTKTKKASENLAILQHQTDSVRGVLNNAMYSTAAVSDATPNLNPARQVLRVPAQRSQFNAEANKTMLTQLIQNLEMAKIASRKEAPLIQIIDSPVLPLQKHHVSTVMGVLLGFIICATGAIVVFILQSFLNKVLQN